MCVRQTERERGQQRQTETETERERLGRPLARLFYSPLSEAKIVPKL